MASVSSSLTKPTYQNPTSGFHNPNAIIIPIHRVVSLHGPGKSKRHGSFRATGVVKGSLDAGNQAFELPLFTSSEAMERLRNHREKHKGNQEYGAMYSSVMGGITTEPAAMVVPMDDHMVHRGHAVFDTAAIVHGYIYELDQHLNRIVSSAGKAKIGLPFDQQQIRKILIQTAGASKCRNGSLRYWLTAGPGDFQLTPSGQSRPALYAVVIRDRPAADPTGVRVITSSVPMKPPRFATVKSTNYLANVMSKMEAEEAGAAAAVWLHGDGLVAEGPSMNVAFVTKGNELVTPRFDGILSGCTARRVLALAERLVGNGALRGVSVRDVTVEEGKGAAEMMLLGSGVLVRPVTQWDVDIIGDGKEGHVTKALLDLLIEDMESGPLSVRVPIPYYV